MLDTTKTGLTAQKEIDAKAGILENLAMKIWEAPETAYNEVKACAWMEEVLKNEGFEVVTGYAGVPTAIKATWGSGKPILGFLGEYDALPGMSQKVSVEKDPVVLGDPGHACGHNLLGTAHVGAVIGMKKEMEEKGLKGTIIYYGCPAEEVLTGKPMMARGGGFSEGLDAVMAWHPGTANRITMGTMTALNTAKFHFKGVTAHAGGDPHNGRSALDAAELMNVGANFLREHVTSDVRIHYVLTESGTAPNIVPDRATNWYYVRAMSREAVVTTYERLIKVAEGAAHMTETKVEIEYMGGCYNTLQNKVLCDLLYGVMKDEVALPVWTAEELKFAEELDKVSANYDRLLAAGKVEEGTHIHSEVGPIVYEDGYGSTDVGDVQHIAPGVFFGTATENLGAAGHSWQFSSCSGHSIGTKGMLQAAKVMAVTGIKLLEDASILDAAKKEFDEVMRGKSYVCPITPEVPVPQPK